MPKAQTHSSLRFEVCEQRDVPSSGTIDLTTAGASANIGGALVRQAGLDNAGTGNIESFVRLQANNTEQGFNTDARPLKFNEKKSPEFTRSLTLAEVPKQTVDGIVYREFVLDINQLHKKPYLNLVELRLYLGNVGDLKTYSARTKQLGGLAPIYDLDATTNHAIRLNARLSSGSGQSDMTLLVPDALFSGGNFVYLYSKFCGANGGFEEWGIRPTDGDDDGGSTAPATLSGRVFYDTNRDGAYTDGETSLAGVTIQLQGTTTLGQSITLYATTDEQGNYLFNNLAAGTYSIYRTTEPTQETPDGLGYADGTNTIGTLGGTAQETDGTSIDGMLNISVTLGQDGTKYDFAMLPNRFD